MFAFAYGFLFRSFHQFYVLVFNLLAIPSRIMKNQGRAIASGFQFDEFEFCFCNLGFVGAKQMRASTREMMICLRKHRVFTVLKRLAVVWPLVFACERIRVACWAWDRERGQRIPGPIQCVIDMNRLHESEIAVNRWCRSWLIDYKGIANKVKTAGLPLAYQIKDGSESWMPKMPLSRWQ